jgi:hypothetical protein
MHSALKLILIVPLLGLLAGAIGLGDQLFAFIFQAGKWIVIGIVALWVLGAVFPRTEGSSAPQLLHPQRDTDLENGYFERTDRSGGILHADGYAFEMRNMGGKLHWREVEPNSKVPLESWISAHPKDAAIRGEKRVMSEHIKIRVNRRKGL